MQEENKVDSRKLPDPCPIPLGWTVRTYRIPEKNGVGIQAVRDGGGEFTIALVTENLENARPSEIVRAPRPMGTTEADAIRLAMLWGKAIEKMRGWASASGEEGR